jgi:hypothetical protein
MLPIRTPQLLHRFLSEGSSRLTPLGSRLYPLMHPIGLSLATILEMPAF